MPRGCVACPKPANGLGLNPVGSGSQGLSTCVTMLPFGFGKKAVISSARQQQQDLESVLSFAHVPTSHPVTGVPKEIGTGIPEQSPTKVARFLLRVPAATSYFTGCPQHTPRKVGQDY